MSTRISLAALTLALGFGVMAARARGVQADPTLDLARGTAPDERSAIARLYAAAAFDRELNMLTRRLDDAGVARIQQALDGASSTERISALVLLASAVAQDALPSGPSPRALVHSVAAIVSGTDPSAAAELVRLHARRVEWHLQVTAMSDSKERAAFLARFLNQSGPDGVYYAYQAIDDLAEAGAPGEQALRTFVAEEARRGIDPEILGRARLGVRKLELSRMMASDAPADVVRSLAAAARVPTRRRMDREFGQWVVGQLAKRRPEADSYLNALADDESVSENVRLAARFGMSDEANGIRWRW